MKKLAIIPILAMALASCASYSEVVYACDCDQEERMQKAVDSTMSDMDVLLSIHSRWEYDRTISRTTYVALKENCTPVRVWYANGEQDQTKSENFPDGTVAVIY